MSAEQIKCEAKLISFCSDAYEWSFDRGILKNFKIPTENCVASIVSGGHFSLVLDNKGRVFGWGDSTYSELGIEPAVGGFVELKFPAKISKISAGERHSLFLDSNGVVYSLGDNACGQCGVPRVIRVNSPTVVQIQNDSDDKIVEVSSFKFFLFLTVKF